MLPCIMTRNARWHIAVLGHLSSLHYFFMIIKIFKGEYSCSFLYSSLTQAATLLCPTRALLPPSSSITFIPFCQSFVTSCFSSVIEVSVFVITNDPKIVRLVLTVFADQSFDYPQSEKHFRIYWFGSKIFVSLSLILPGLAVGFVLISETGAVCYFP